MSDQVDWSRWIGRREERTDWINPNRLAAWNATLDRDDPFPQEGEAVPPGFHWTLFPPLARQSELGHDGHATKGAFLPPVPLPQRLWAGSRLRFHRPVRVGEEVEQVSTIDRLEEKRGRTGPLVFVTVRHLISGAQGAAIEEQQDIVYRDPPTDQASTPDGQTAPVGAWTRQIQPDETLLFRYSALTFNGHRIHYDRRFATGSEGYPGLVVHGPLIATLLLDLLRRHRPAAAVERFMFRALRPTFDTSAFGIHGAPAGQPDPVRLWSTDNRGQIAIEAEAWMR